MTKTVDSWPKTVQNGKLSESFPYNAAHGGLFSHRHFLIVKFFSSNLLREFMNLNKHWTFILPFGTSLEGGDVWSPLGQPETIKSETTKRRKKAVPLVVMRER